MEETSSMDREYQSDETTTITSRETLRPEGETKVTPVQAHNLDDDDDPVKRFASSSVPGAEHMMGPREPPHPPAKPNFNTTTMECESADDEDKGIDRKRAFTVSTAIQTGADFPNSEESKAEEEGCETGFSFADKEVVLVDPSIISDSPALEANHRNTNHIKARAAAPPRTSLPEQQIDEEKQQQLFNLEYDHGMHSPPPAIPRPTAFASAAATIGGVESDYENKTEYERQQQQQQQRRYKSSGPALLLPDYKAQVNSRSFLNIIDPADLLVDGVAEHSSSGATPSPSSSSTSAAGHNLQQQQHQHLPVTFPVVAQHVTTPSMTRRISDTTNGSHPQQDDADIPVVSAVLVPQERLEAEHRQHSEGQHSGTTTLSNTDSSVASQNIRGHRRDNNDNINSNNDDNGRSSTSDPKDNPPSERQFWISMIVLAVTLNSLLVTGVVVASFCAAGKCKPSTAQLQIEVPSPPNINVPVLAPTLAPTAADLRRLSVTPSVTPTVVPFVGGASDVPPSNMTTPVGGITELVPQLNATTIPSPTGAESDFFAPIAVGTATPTPTASVSIPPVPVGNVARTSAAPSNSSHAGGTAENDNQGDGNAAAFSSGPSLVLLETLLAVAVEAVILSGLYVYYRRWRKRLKVNEEREPNGASSEITSTGLNRSNKNKANGCREDDASGSEFTTTLNERVDL